MKSIAFLSVFILGANAGYDFIEPCHWSDKECIKKSANKVLPFFAAGDLNMGMPSLDPLDLKGTTINGDTGELKLKFKDMVVKNLSRCEIEDIERTDKLHLTLTLNCPFIATGEYDVRGNMLGQKLYGHDTFDIRTEQIKINVTITMGTVEKDGEHYYKFTKFDYKYEPVKKFHFIFNKLLEGDQEKAKVISQLLNDSWKDIVNVFGKPIIKEIVVRVIKICGIFFNKVPCNDLELS